MTDWRYWITYEGQVQAADETAAIRAAMSDWKVKHDDETRLVIPDVEVEAIDNAGN